MKKESLYNFYNFFKINEVVKKETLINFLLLYYKELKPATIEWRISDLKNSGYLTYLGKGDYKILDKKEYKPFNLLIEPDLIKDLVIYNNNINLSPFRDDRKIAVWNTKILNQFTTHQIYKSYTIIEINEYRMDDLYFYLMNNFKNVFPSSKINELDYLTYKMDHVYIIEKLPKRSPLSKEKNTSIYNSIFVPKLEKILVDLFVYNNTLFPYDESEIANIYRNVFKMYPISMSSLLNYARVRGKRVRNNIELLLKEMEISLYD